MKQDIKIGILTAAVAFFFSLAQADPNSPPTPPQQNTPPSVITLKDFTSEEVKGLGFTLSKDLTVTVNAVGGGSTSMWSDEEKRQSRSNNMFAYGWIIDADTRKIVWEMTTDNTSGKDDQRKFDETVSLNKGSYEVYFSVHTYSVKSGLSFYSNNIDRRDRTSRRTGEKFMEKLLGWFDDDYRNIRSRFMERAKDVWGIRISTAKGDEQSVKTFNAPKRQASVVFEATGVGDAASVKKIITVSRDVTARIYALGEGRGKNDVFDYGWLTNTSTRERVWDMNVSNTEHAGGASKNILFNGDVRLPKGAYELSYVTDDSHSREDWNSSPPYDPFNYGISIIAKNESDRSAFSVSDYEVATKNIIVQLVKARDDEFLQTGFTLKEESRLHIYAIGEGHPNVKVEMMGKTYVSGRRNTMADYGWIINAKTRERVWEMRIENTVHAGGASKNRLADEIITLPKGDYLVYYQTDDSHAYNDWNDDKPFDADFYGITVMGTGEKFSMKNVAPFTETESENVLAQLTKVRDDKHVRQRFLLDRTMKVRVYAIGEGVGNSMADYAWIENAKTGEVVWEMTYRTTTHAGGAKKNRLYDRHVLLEKGEYEVHFQTDDSHAYNDWNDDAPDDRTHWGVTIYKE
jgi:hypothetical protein